MKTLFTIIACSLIAIAFTSLYIKHKDKHYNSFEESVYIAIYNFLIGWCGITFLLAFDHVEQNIFTLLEWLSIGGITVNLLFMRMLLITNRKIYHAGPINAEHSFLFAICGLSLLNIGAITLWHTIITGWEIVTLIMGWH